MTDSRFCYVTYIRTTPDNLWAALVEPEITRRYWSETTQVSDWRPGSSWWLLKPNGDIADSGEVIEYEPPRRLVVTWQNQFNDQMRAEGFSHLTYELEPVGTSVKLKLTHTMQRPGSKLIEAVSAGWPHILASLKSLLETGAPLEETRYWPQGV